MTLPKTKSHRSASQIKTFVDCSEAYRIKYIDHPDYIQPPAAWLAQGSAYHETIQAYEESGRNPLFDLTEHYQRAYDLHIAAMKALEPDLKKWLRAPSKKTEQDISERRERGIAQLQNYINHIEDDQVFIKPLDDYLIGIEVPFEITLGGITIKGAIDQIREYSRTGVQVVDVKSGNREVVNFQLGIYKVAVEKIFGWKVESAGYFYGKDGKLALLDKATLDRYTEAYVTDLITTLDRGIENRVFIPNTGSHCTLCSVRRFCREFS